MHKITTHRPGKVEEYTTAKGSAYRIHCECAWGKDDIATWDDALKDLKDHVILENSMEFAEIIDKLKDAAGRRGNGRYNWSALAEHVLANGYQP